jgi:hypothetical protein
MDSMAVQHVPFGLELTHPIVALASPLNHGQSMWVWSEKVSSDTPCVMGPETDEGPPVVRASQALLFQPAAL